jgi:hypothetical protein
MPHRAPDSLASSAAQPDRSTLAVQSLAVTIAAIAMIGEALRSWGVDRPWLAILDDYIVGALLLVGAALARRRGGLAMLAGAFGFAAGVFFSSFAMHVDALARRVDDPGHFSQPFLTCAIGALLVGSIVGVIASSALATRRPTNDRR